MKSDATYAGDPRRHHSEIVMLQEQVEALRTANRALREYVVIWANRNAVLTEDNRRLQEQLDAQLQERVDALTRQSFRHPYRVDL